MSILLIEICSQKSKCTFLFKNSTKLIFPINSPTTLPFDPQKYILWLVSRLLVFHMSTPTVMAAIVCAVMQADYTIYFKKYLSMIIKFV